jgi:RNA polymerase sigma-70 factor (ECF subfamily)
MSAAELAVESMKRPNQCAETERLWEAMHERLLSYIRGRTASSEDAEDILQDVFLRIHTNLHRVQESQSVTAWIYRITRNAIVDYHRASAKEVGALGSIHGNGEIADRNGPEDGGNEIYRQAVDEFAHCLNPFLDQLPEHYRQAVVLTEIEGLRQTEAARRLGISVSGMKSRVQRGRGRLKEAILNCCAVEFDRRGGLVDYARRDGGACPDCDCG